MFATKTQLDFGKQGSLSPVPEAIMVFSRPWQERLSDLLDSNVLLLNKDMIIYLIGFMGSGKTTLGRRLAKKIEYDFVDMDELIESQQGMSVSAIFQQKGESLFRAYEGQVLRELSQRKNLVVATGGGAPCTEENIALMNHSGVSVYLRMSPQSLASRLENAQSIRPLVQNLRGEELLNYITEKLQQRECFYQQAHCVLKGENARPEHVMALVFGHPSP